MYFRQVDRRHELIRWRLVIHSGIDGYTRKIVYLGRNNNNSALTVLEMSEEAVKSHGSPSQVRCDMRVENVEVAIFHAPQKI